MKKICSFQTGQLQKTTSLPSSSSTQLYLRAARTTTHAHASRVPAGTQYASAAESEGESMEGKMRIFHENPNNLYCKLRLVGGWTNPSEKYARQIGSSPQEMLKIKNLWNHQREDFWKRIICLIPPYFTGFWDNVTRIDHSSIGQFVVKVAELHFRNTHFEVEKNIDPNLSSFSSKGWGLKSLKYPPNLIGSSWEKSNQLYTVKKTCQILHLRSCQNESNTTNTLQMRINGKLNSSQQFHLNLLAGTFLFSSATSHGFPSKVKRYLMVMVTVCRCCHSLTQKRKISTFSPSGCCEICNKRNTLWSACGPDAVSRGNREYR